MIRMSLNVDQSHHNIQFELYLRENLLSNSQKR